MGRLAIWFFSGLASGDGSRYEYLLFAGIVAALSPFVTTFLFLLLCSRRCEQIYSFLHPSLDVCDAWFDALKHEVPLEGAPWWCT